ncbi:MAG: DciA family protein [Rothia sp. (in: high G+C Gram-positive bacteria)]|nr:DciA family protein [Rothia sp. (in: high G+C Gram-positive bacteria)]
MNIPNEEYDQDDLDAPHALLSRIRAAKEARGEVRLQGAAGQKIIRDFGRHLAAGSKPGPRSFRSPSSSQLGGYSGSGPSTRDPQGLGSLLERVVMERGWSTPVAVSSVLTRWDSIVGPQLAAQAQPESFEDGVIRVRCQSTAWAVQLRTIKFDLIRRFNQELGQELVRDLKVLGPSVPSWKKGRWTAPGGRGPRDTYG